MHVEDVFRRSPVWAFLLAGFLALAPLAAAQEPDEGVPDVEEDSPEIDEDGPEVDEDGPEMDEDSPDGDAWKAGQGGDDSPEAEAEDEGNEEDDHEDGIDDEDDSFETAPAAPAGQPIVGFNVSRMTGSLLQENVTTLATVLQDVAEFLDEDGNLRYDVGEPVLQRFVLAGVNGTLHAPGNMTRLVGYELPAGGNLSLVFHLDQADPLRPAKFDVVIESFPFQSPLSRLAVSLQVHVAGGIRFADIDGDPAIMGLGEEAPFLSWTRAVSVDGQPGLVGASLHLPADASAAEGTLTWSYPQGVRIVHDPVLGVVPAAASLPLPEDLGDGRVVILAAAAGTALLAIGFALRRRTPL